MLAVALLLPAGGIARAAALVGETRQVEIESASQPVTDQLKAAYRRPDTIPFPVSNLYTAAKAMLGRALFYDTRVSGNGALSCASCHNPGFGYGDGLAKGLGDHMNLLTRRSPSVVNSAWGELYMWDGRSASLEEQVAGPIESTSEMNRRMETLPGALGAIDEYRSLFEAAFPSHPITPTTIADALATYERTIVSGDAPFDVWIEGDETAISDAAKRGFAVFNTKARCALCHGGWLFTDDGFHDIGLPDNDKGRGALFPRIVAMQHAFKTPSLRETARRGPYMHDGSLRTLDAVVAHYNQGGSGRPSQSELVKPIGLSPDEQAQIVAFLQTLTGAIRASATPVLPR
jgi:cytochrome c peroxidase